MDLGEWVPGLKLTPFFAERVTYETNVFQVPSGSQADVIFKTIPGFLADYTFGPHAATLGYRAEILNYVTLTDQDTVNHVAVAQLRLDFPKLLVNVRDDFVKTSDPPNTELTGPIESLTNVLAPEAEYRLTTRLALGANYAWTHVRFPTEPVAAADLDRDEHLFGASVFWKIQPKADLRLNYNYGIKNFTHPDRSRRHAVISSWLGVRGDLTAKLSSTFRIGVEKRDPDSSSQPGYLGPIMGGDSIFRPTERTTLTLVTDRSVQESTFGDVPFYVTTSGGLGRSAPVLEQAHRQPPRVGGPGQVSDQADRERADRLAQRHLLHLRGRARLRHPAVALRGGGVPAHRPAVELQCVRLPGRQVHGQGHPAVLSLARAATPVCRCNRCWPEADVCPTGARRDSGWVL